MAGLDFLLGAQGDDANAMRMGLLSAGLGMLANNTGHYGAFAPAAAAGGMAGLQGYQGALDQQAQGQYKQAQMAQLQQKAEAEKARQEAIAAVSSGYQTDPTNYKPNMGHLLAIDPDAAIKGMMGVGKGTEFGLVPQIGINPQTGKPGYFIQDKAGGTRWVDAGVPDKFTLIPGTDYRAPETFNPLTGVVSPVQRGAPQAGGVGIPQVGGGAGYGQEPAPTVDPLAPWTKIVSPKEQDQVRARTYEQDSKRLDDMRERVRTGRSIMADLERFGELNRNQATGGLVDRAGGWLPTMDADKREMEAIQARLAPNMRPAGSGTTSDRDLALYLAALPSVDKEGPVNKNIRDQYAKQLKDAESELAFREKYLTEKGHLVGVDKAYQESLIGDKPTAAPQAPQEAPIAAINMLKRNPNLRAQFDAKYGQGAAARALGR